MDIIEEHSAKRGATEEIDSEDDQPVTGSYCVVLLVGIPVAWVIKSAGNVQNSKSGFRRFWLPENGKFT